MHLVRSEEVELGGKSESVVPGRYFSMSLFSLSLGGRVGDVSGEMEGGDEKICVHVDRMH
jgi:hypothetical protein